MRLREVYRACRSLLLSAAVGGVCLLGELAHAGDIAIAAADGSLWSQPKEMLAVGVLKGASFRPVDENNFRFRGSKNLTVAGIAPKDILIQWNDGMKHIVGVNTTFYNKGDDGPLTKAVFEEALKRSLDAISLVMQVDPKVRKVDKKEAGVKPRAWEWENGNCAMMLEALSSGAGKKFVSEFIRLTIVPDRASLERGGADDAAKKSELKEHVRTDKEGTVWIEGIPMVDQGEKGYCVPAAISRVFAYYNMDGVDQHALASICKSNDMGTSLEAMNKALVSISSKFHMGITSWKWPNQKTFEKELMKDFQKKRIPLDKVTNKMLLEQISTKTALLRKGLKDISKYIDAGIPIVWGVMLGIIPEQGLPQSMGGHMRLIIGYNEEQQMILYTDSWGAGHDLKAMPLAQACAISQILYVLRPLR